MKKCRLIIGLMLILSLLAAVPMTASAVTVAKPQINITKWDSDSITLKLTRQSNVSGYYIYQKIDGKYKKIYTKKGNKTGSSYKYKVTGLKPGKTYYFKAKAYKSINGRKYTSDFSKSTHTKTEYDFAKYDGKYTNADYGDIRIIADNTNLNMVKLVYFDGDETPEPYDRKQVYVCNCIAENASTAVSDFGDKLVFGSDGTVTVTVKRYYVTEKFNKVD